MSNRAIVQFDEFPLSMDTLRKLPEDQVAALAVLSFAVSEANALQRIFLSQSHGYTGEKLIDEVMNVQKFVILRTWSSKLFEVREFLQSLCGIKRSTKDGVLYDLANQAIDDLERTTNTEGYRVARDIRNESSNHYLLEAARKNLPHVHSDALCNIYIHQHSGNDFFPLGEAVMFHGRLHRRWKNDSSLEERKRKFGLWIDWCIDASSSFDRSHARFANAIIFEPLGRNRFHRKTYWVSESLVGHPMERLTPVVFRRDGKQ